MSDNVIDARSKRRLVILPTYNEVSNLSAVVDDILRWQPCAHVLIVDDNSPDGTGALAERLALDAGGHVHVMHRADKTGLGTAYLAGFKWALAHDYDVIVEMDADGSHDPRYLSDLFTAIDAGADVAIGSRYVLGGGVQNWPRRRWILSRVANRYAQMSLGTRIHDITAGYRAYRRSVLEAIDLDSVMSNGYCFQIEMAWRATSENFTLVERPIMFADRQHGASKMRGRDLAEAARRVTLWGLQSKAPERLGALGNRKRTAGFHGPSRDVQANVVSESL